MHAEVAAYIAHLNVTQKSSLTVARYGAVLEALEAFVANREPASVTREQIRRFASSPRKDGTSRTPAGVNVRIAITKAFFRFLREERGLEANPTAGVVGVPEPRRTPKYLTVPELHRLLGHVAGDTGRYRLRNLAIAVTLWQTALRVSELARLDVGQLDREARVLRDVRVKRGNIFDVPLNTEALAVIDRYLATRGRLAPTAPLIARRDGGRLSVRAIEALFEKWRRELGWTRPLHPHSMRHAFATQALASGTDVAVVADLLRHSGLSTVLVYAQVLDGPRREALAKLGRLVPSCALPPTLPTAPVEAAPSAGEISDHKISLNSGPAANDACDVARYSAAA